MRQISVAGAGCIDRIGREGMMFENATCVPPYCSSSRASLLTGVYPHTRRIPRLPRTFSVPAAANAHCLTGLSH